MLIFQGSNRDIYRPEAIIATRPVSLLLGGGRQTTDDAIDFAAGLSGIKKIGERVEKDEPLLVAHARNDQTLRSVVPLLEKAIDVGR